jgi:hypothetical protein
MSESALVRKIIAAVRAKYKRAYVRKINDRNSRGIPDLLIVFPRGDRREILHPHAGVLFVEAKTEVGVVSKIQEIEHKQIENVGAYGCWVIVARDINTVMETLEEMGALP